MITDVNKSKTLVKHVSCNFRCKIDGRKCNSSKNGIILSNFKWQDECKKPITHCVYRKYYAWNLIVRACECCKNLNT